MPKIIPAILTDDPAILAKQIRLAEGMADEVQIDFMDGQFVETVSVSPETLAATHPKITVEAHLMVKRPDLFVVPFKRNTVKRVIFHAEAVDNIDFMIRLFKDEGFSVGLALNPETSIAVVRQHLPELELVQCMGVHPGRQGNPFVPAVLDKIRSLRKEWPTGTIAIDGGVETKKIKEIVAAGTDRLVAGHAIFGLSDPLAAYHDLKQTLDDHTP